MTAEQSEVRDVYANPDGSFTAELHIIPVRVKRGAGWVPVDTTLRQRADGGVEPAAITVPVVFSGGGDQPLVRLGQDKRQVELRWPGSLPKPVLNRDSATYPEVLPGVDLRVSATAQGFSQALVVKDKTAAANPKLAELTFGVTAKGAKVRDDGHGDVGAYDDKGKLVLGSGAPMAWDSTPSAPKQAVGEVDLGKDTLVLRPDRKLLTDPATTFPVRIMADFPATQTGWAMVLSGHKDDHYWGGDGQNLAKVGYCGYDGCNGIGVARSYFQYDASFLLGRHILEAEFNAFENYAPKCRTPRVVEAWGTNPVDPGTSWGNQPFPGGGPVYLGGANVSFGYDASCPGDWVGFPAAAAVIKGLNEYGGRTAIMLKAADEGEALSWKKFDTNPSLDVTYNSYPNEPTGQTVENDKACAVQPNEPYINPYIDNDPNKGPRGPKLAAVVSDPDGGLVQAQFEWYTRFGARLGVTATEFKASGSTFSVDVPSANAGDGANLAYRVRGADGVDFGPWGQWCDVTIDRKAPDKAPKVSSVTYPECPPPDYDPCPRGGGVGRTGGFTLGADGVQDVAGFEYHLYGQEVFKTNATSGAANILVTPPEDGSMDLYARSVDRAENVGPEYRYHFIVGPGTPPRGHWKLEGYVEKKAVDDSPNGHDATIGSDTARWRVGRHGDALWLDGATAYANTAGGATVDTKKTFTVSAWVKLDRLDTTFRTAVSQDGTRISGFFLQYNPSTKKWNFMMPASDADNAERHIAESPTQAVAGRWTHLVGTYDAAAAQQIKIYVDGVAGTPAGHTTPWGATGTVQLGRARYAAGPVDYWPGSLDEVRIYDRTLAAEEIHDLAAAPAAEELFLPLDEGTGTTAQEASGNYRVGTLGSAGSWTTGKVGTGAVRFDGTSATLSTSGPALRTDAGFTVTAWVKLDAADDQTRTVLSQDAGQVSGFQLRYRGDTHKWSFALPQSETDAQLALSADSGESAQDGEWTHLAGVYDPADQEVRLYVDGVKVAWKKGPATVNATGAFQVGQGRQNSAAATPFAGEIDDVHAWTGVRTPDQIKAERQKPVTGRRSLYGGQLARYYNLTGHHIVTNGPVPPGSHFEFSLGMTAPADAPNTQALYSCRSGTGDYFLAYDCGTYTNLGSVGRLYTTPPAGVPTRLIYRCQVPGVGHFASADPGCEGQTTELPALGYTRAYTRLIRHTTTGYPYDHASATARLEANYRPEGSAAILSMTQLPGTTALLSCQDGIDTFSSTDSACEGKTVVRRLGFIWTSAPQDVPGAPGAIGVELFRCRASWGDLFDSGDPRCEGQTLDRSLGFVATGL
ncbi:LamG-like jellyroll fold domain-containing protein [Nonomuraea sp. NEAU-A123]|uniref:LamG-like jellyroll fold domain-containing protein n=1 Tax=Nonomuraea sp. NEAU-A123 TaxID=2839649 RepID=UPI001BE444DB|nr:LamG-like jellyroll fold domain-containing protein [Nonomuraea sp. NEAU-A123]